MRETSASALKCDFVVKMGISFRYQKKLSWLYVLSTILRQFFFDERWLAFGDPSPLRLGKVCKQSLLSA